MVFPYLYVSTNIENKNSEGSWFVKKKKKSPVQKLTIVGEVLSHVEEGEGHQEVEGPVDSGCTGVPCAPRPQRVDL